MDKGSVAGIIIWAICAYGCAALFFGIGIWAEHAKKPVHFWAGTKIDAQKVTDIPAYNHANAVMWKWYALPYFLSGILGCLDSLHAWCMPAAVILMVAACFPCIFIMIWRYTKIEKTYILR